MHENRPVTQSKFRAAPGVYTGLRAFWIFLLGAGVLFLTASAASAQAAVSTQAKGGAALPNGYVGSETCATCHDEVAKGFANNPHTKMAMMHGSTGVTCENCHGAGKEHVDGGGDVTKIFNPAKHSTKEVDDKCLSCHAGAHPNFDRSPHAKANVGCISCHSVHQSKEDHLLKASQPTLCYQCHSDQKGQFSMLFHHKVNEGVVKCSDCHDVHGTFQPNNVKVTVDQNAICTKCHSEVRGPFVYEHAPVKAEGCTACHTPHGSQNPRMLNMPSINTLCHTCHSQVAQDTIHGVSAGSNDSIPCTTCHTYIHGSNMHPAFLR